MSMTPHDSREEWITRQALERPEAERTAFLELVCGRDPSLLERVVELMRQKQATVPSEGTAVDADALRQRVEARLQAEAKAEGRSALDTYHDRHCHPQDVMAEDRPGALIGRYRLREKIGEGGFGVVYVAEQREPVTRRVALKVIKLGMDTRQVVTRFEAERQALALMDHPNIAKVLDAGATDAGRPYFVMELVRGIAIARYCDENNLSTEKRLQLFIQVCQAIQHAHQKGIIHRDIKPSNILVTLSGEKPVPKVIDFGIAKATQGELTDKTVYTQLQQFIGTPGYVSPEQAEMSGLDIDTRSDIYSLGVLLYELLVGKTPFDSKDLIREGLDAIRRAIREQEPARPSTRLRNMSQEEQTTTAKRRGAEALKLISILRGDLDWIVMKCLEKDRTLRYDTSNALATDVQRFLNSEPVVARPPSPAYRFQRLVRRNQLAFVAAVAVSAALLLGLGVSTWLFIREKAALRMAVDERRRARKGEADARHLLYIANMDLAQQAWEQNNVSRLKQLLEETQSDPDRDFEWFYWQRQIHSAVMTLCGHGWALTSVAFSPDGQRIATSSLDYKAKIWDATSGRDLLTLRTTGDPILCLDFSPDGGRIVTGTHEGFIQIWDAANGRTLLAFPMQSNHITSLSFSHDGQHIVTGEINGTVKLWDAGIGRELLVLHADRLSSVAISQDGRRIATSGDDSIARVWETSDGVELLRLVGHLRGISSVSFSQDGKRALTGSQDGTAKIWDAFSGQVLLTLRDTSPITAAAFSPSGESIATGSADGTAKLWESPTGLLLRSFKEHTGGVTFVAFSPSGQFLATASQDRTAKIWDVTSNQEPHTLYAFSGYVRSVAISPSGRQIAAAGWQTVKTWDVASGRALLTFDGHTDMVRSVAFCPITQRIVTGSEDGTVRVWDPMTTQEKLVMRPAAKPKFLVGAPQVVSVAVSPDETQIAAGIRGGSVLVWDLASGKELLTLAEAGAPTFSPDGHRIATCQLATKIWDARTGQLLLTIDAKRRTNGVGIQLFPIQSVAFSSDNAWMVGGSYDGTAQVWETSTGKELLTLRGHTAEISSVAFSPKGQRIVTASQDGTVKLWQVASGKELLSLRGQSGILSVALSPDGNKIVAGCQDGSVKIWSAATTEEVAQCQQEERLRAQTLFVAEQEFVTENKRQRVTRAR